jgi:hypothetical protein
VKKEDLSEKEREEIAIQVIQVNSCFKAVMKVLEVYEDLGPDALASSLGLGIAEMMLRAERAAPVYLAATATCINTYTANLKLDAGFKEIKLDE